MKNIYEGLIKGIRENNKTLQVSEGIKKNMGDLKVFS